jgi:hypothetical protein
MRGLLVNIHVDAKAGMLKDKILKRTLLVIQELDVGVVHVDAHLMEPQKLRITIRTVVS